MIMCVSLGFVSAIYTIIALTTVQIIIPIKYSL